MGGRAPRRCLVAIACLCAALAACGQSKKEPTYDPVARTPAPAPRVALTPDEREAWALGPPDRSIVPVLLYHRIDPEKFARQMVLLDHAGYETIALDEFIRFMRREEVSLPPRPLLLTFDGARAESWTGSDGILRELDFNATLFVDVGRVEAEDPAYLTWKELNTLQRSGRWEVQLQSGTGNRRIRYGPAPQDVGAFYAYRGAEEVLAFAPPYGNYGQAGTNDPRIPRELLTRLLDSFDVVFTQDRSGLASPGAGKTRVVGRIEITPKVTDGELHALLAHGAASG